MRILAAIDGSSDSKAAVAWLEHLPLPADHEVLVVTAVVAPARFIDMGSGTDVRAALVAEARRLVDDTVARLRPRGRARGEVIEDDARDAIVGTARDSGADLVLLGARGLGAVARFLLGSVSLAVAREATCPVLVCKGSAREVRSVTVALDGSDHARHALDWLTTSLALPRATRIRLVGVVEPERYPATAPGAFADTLRAAVAAVETERRAALEGELSNIANGLRGRWPETETAVIVGIPAEAIVQDAERTGADLVVVGARGTGGVSRLLLGSVSEAVLTHAACPVLVVRLRDRPVG